MNIILYIIYTYMYSICITQRHLINIGLELFLPWVNKKNIITRIRWQILGDALPPVLHFPSTTSKYLLRKHEAKNSIKGTLVSKFNRVVCHLEVSIFCLHATVKHPNTHHIRSLFLSVLSVCFSAETNVTYPSCKAQTAIQNSLLKKGRLDKRYLKSVIITHQKKKSLFPVYWQSSVLKRLKHTHVYHIEDLWTVFI